jgi:general secretion pathway protein L
MATTEVSVAGSDGFHALAARAQDFSRWWAAELRQLVPSRWLSWAADDVLPRLLIWRDRDLAVCSLASAAGPVQTQFPLRGFGAAALNSWLAERGLRRDQVMVGPVIGNDSYFLRDLSVPKAAFSALPKILDQEVLRRTPFQLSEIWHAAIPTASHEADIVTMGHWIIRKDRAEAALAELGLTATDVDFLAAGDPEGEVTPVIVFRATRLEDPPWARRAAKLLAAAGLGAVLLGLGAFEWCQASVATGIEASLIEARGGAQGNRGGSGQAAGLFAMKADAGILEIWDELSRILPDHTFLTETRVADGTVTLSGFSADAAHLVRVIDKSPLFSGAALAAAITPDAAEHKDRFSISFKVRGGRTAPPAGTARSPAS